MDLHDFDDAHDGRYAETKLVLSNNVLYGTAGVGGAFDRGTIFSVRTDGADFTVLHDFSATGDFPTNTDGAYPEGALVLSGNTLYGTTTQGGTSLVGTVFRMNMDGTAYTNLHSFTQPVYVYPRSTNDDGAYPTAELVLSGDTLYGIAPRGGTFGNGAIFAVNTDGTGFTNLHNFADNEGAYSQGGLLLVNDTLYGTTYTHNGTVFKLSTNGGNYTILHTFSYNGSQYPVTNADGAAPQCALVLAGNRLCGTTAEGGPFGAGTIFSLNTDGTGFTNLHYFSQLPSYASPQTNWDGATLQAGLTACGEWLYGTATGGGNSGTGTIFAVRTNGADFTVLHHFPLGEAVPINLFVNEEGGYPRGEVLFSDNHLIGTTGSGGRLGHGAVFSFSLLPVMDLKPNLDGLAISWPVLNIPFTNTFVLQTATNLTPPVKWSDEPTAPMQGSGLNTVITYPMAEQQFFRLRQ